MRGAVVDNAFEIYLPETATPWDVRGEDLTLRARQLSVRHRNRPGSRDSVGHTGHIAWRRRSRAAAGRNHALPHCAPAQLCMPPSEAATPSLSGVPTSRDHCGPPLWTQPAIGQSKPSAAPAGARHPPESRS